MTTPNDPVGGDDPKTVFAPLPSSGAATDDPPAQSAVEAAFPLAALPNPVGFEPRHDGRIRIGDVLNHIYEVRRFIARGGMGEVYEGVNVKNARERVAIKVILPALAADPNVVAMFDREAKILSPLSHPALVQYRLFAQDPQLGVLYIVTDYIDGANLADVIKTVPRDAASLSGLLRRLAEGLRAAHEFDAVHRDISPDNVILERGQLERARIIDFGIAKDLDPAKQTIVGDGFAGKLGYVAPEQLGDFDRNVGAWSDVYSLALVILSIASGGNLDMGGTLVQAVDKRRAGIDVSVAPEPLQPILKAMLQPDPQHRIRSMADVIAALSDPSLMITPPAVRKVEKAPKVGKPTPSGRGLIQSILAIPRMMLGGVLAAAVALAGVGFWAMHGAPPQAKGPAPTPVAAGSPEVAARSVLAATLPRVACSWLDIQKFESNSGGLSLVFKGVAGNTITAQTAIADALTKANLKLDSISLENVASVKPSVCPLLDAYRQVKSPPPGDLSTDQSKYEMEIQTSGTLVGKSAAVPQIHIAAEALAGELVLGGIDPDGTATATVQSATALKTAVSGPGNGGMNPDGSATLKGNWANEGLVGIVLIHGKNAIDVPTVFPALNARGEVWKSRFVAQARSNGWSADMVWFNIVNEVPDVAPPATPVTTPQAPSNN